MGLTYRATVWPAQPEMTQTGHHETPRDARQIGRQVVGVAVCKVFLLGVAAKLRLAKGSTTIDKRGGSMSSLGRVS